MGQVRQGESRAALPLLGVEGDKQTYWDEPDTQLVKYLGRIARRLVSHAQYYNLHDYFTLGPTGYDGHSDHIATHAAVMMAQDRLARLGHPLTVWALSTRSGHDVAMPTVYTPKLRALAQHTSQMPLRRDNQGVLRVINQQHWDRFVANYGQVLFGEERYRIIRPQQLGAVAVNQQLRVPA